MAERVLESADDLEYEGHKLKIEHRPPENEDSWPIFVISKGDSYIECEEGYGEAILEPNILYVSYVNSQEKGMGAVLMKAALEEGRHRGFELARTYIANPKIITILKKLEAEGVIGAVTFFKADINQPSLTTPQLLEQAPRISAEEAQAFLNSFPLDGRGYQEHVGVRSVIDISVPK